MHSAVSATDCAFPLVRSTAKLLIEPFVAPGSSTRRRGARAVVLRRPHVASRCRPFAPNTTTPLDGARAAVGGRRRRVHARARPPHRRRVCVCVCVCARAPKGPCNKFIFLASDSAPLRRLAPRPVPRAAEHRRACRRSFAPAPLAAGFTRGWCRARGTTGPPRSTRLSRLAAASCCSTGCGPAPRGRRRTGESSRWQPAPWR